MKKLLRRSFLLSSAAFATVGMRSASAAVIAQWSFNTITSSDNTPAATTDNTGGTAMALSLGMSNTYSYANGEGPGSSGPNNDITSVTGATSLVTEDGWRIRGTSNTKNAGPGLANGWNNTAPNFTQGAEFSVSTVGYTNIGFSFDWFSTNQGVANLQVRYSINGTSFTSLGSDYLAVSGDFYGATAGGAPSPNITVDLSAIPGAANDPTFAIELVSVKPISSDANFSTTTAGDYASASGGNYNNSSGNWSFNNITFTGSVPEPTSLSLLGLTGLAMLKRCREQRR
jgi:hypothetical protein